VGEGQDSDGKSADVVVSETRQRSVTVQVTTLGIGYDNPTVDVSYGGGGDVRFVPALTIDLCFSFFCFVSQFGFHNCIDSDPVSGLPESRITFTGDAKKDFTSSKGYYVYFQDNPRLSAEFPDVGVPRQVRIARDCGCLKFGVC
jgi:hypothetical protein